MTGEGLMIKQGTTWEREGNNEHKLLTALPPEGVLRVFRETCLGDRSKIPCIADSPVRAVSGFARNNNITWKIFYLGKAKVRQYLLFLMMFVIRSSDTWLSRFIFQGTC